MKVYACNANGSQFAKTCIDHDARISRCTYMLYLSTIHTSSIFYKLIAMLQTLLSQPKEQLRPIQIFLSVKVKPNVISRELRTPVEETRTFRLLEHL